MRPPFVEFRLSPDDVSAIRFGISPGHELSHAVRVLARPQDHPLQWGWLRLAGRSLPESAFELLKLVVGTEGYLPDFLTSTPTWDLTPEVELERLTTADPGPMVVDLGKRVARTTGTERQLLEALRDDPLRTRTLVARAWSEFWAAALEPFWASIDRLLKADIGSRARRTASQGLGGMVDSLQEAVSWSTDAVRVRLSHHGEVLDCRGSGLVLVPSVMSRRCAALTEPPAQPTLFYPALGVTENWAAGSTTAAPSTAAVDALLGSGRARLLVVLQEPLTTTEAAATAGLAVSTASHHLGILRAAGLVDSRRAGPAVLHVRTALGDALVSGAGDSDRP